MAEYLTAEKNREGSGDRLHYELAIHSEVTSQLLNDNLPQIRERFVLKLLKGKAAGMNDLQWQAEKLDLSGMGPLYRVYVFAAGDPVCAVATEISMCFLRDRMYDSCSGKNMTLLCCMDANEQMYCVVSASLDETYTLFEKKLSSLLACTAAETGIQIFYGIGPVVDRLTLLAESFNVAKTNMEQAMTLKGMPILDETYSQYQSNETVQEHLLQLFRKGDMAAVANAVNEYVAFLKLNTPGRQVLIERFVVVYLQNITNECMRLGVTLERFESYVPAVVCLMQSDTMGSVDAVLQLTEQILKHISVHRTSESNHLLNMAKDYILANIGDERLDLAAVSDHVGLSRVYFCKLFHQMEGVSFNTYLKKIRIEKAKHLLLTTNMKVFEVSNAVGFSHAKYFGYVFKEAVGQTPVEFQKSTHKEYGL